MYTLRSRTIPLNFNRRSPSPPLEERKITIPRYDTVQTMAFGAHDKWMREPVICELTSIPGVGRAARLSLESVGIFTTWQMIGKFLMFNRDIESYMEWLGGFSCISSNKTTIARAIAEKVSIMLGD